MNIKESASMPTTLFGSTGVSAFMPEGWLSTGAGEISREPCPLCVPNP